MTLRKTRLKFIKELFAIHMINELLSNDYFKTLVKKGNLDIVWKLFKMDGFLRSGLNVADLK